ncbi:protein of unknown function DUF882 [hydrothermal vent metagenome]|uniref:DUF1254 domain-containing protein n=1 Tax=hydrothermal vent metagenome TaxID=652676 RepID=A0A3B0SS22_9ZZZZ
MNSETNTQSIDDVPEGYNTPIPPSITTPDRVETRLGTLEFVDGLPTDETATKIFDNLAFMRGVETFLNCIPAASIEAMRRGNVELGVTAANKVVLMDELMDSSPLFLTGNTDTVYASAILDLERDGATVVEIPPKCGPGTVNDAWFRFVIDMGAPGPDRGAGGKYLILPPDHEGEVPEGYFVAKSPSYVNWLILRGFLVDGKPDAAAGMFRDGLKIYPLADVDDPPEMEFISGSGKYFNTIHANDVAFYAELNDVVQKEPIDVIDPETRGLMASIGIIKGEPFAPDEEMHALLVDAAAVANATARSVFFHAKDPEAYLYEGRYWKVPFVGGDYRWLKDDGVGGRNLDARTYFFYMATVNTPAMALKMIGKGSQYAAIDRSSDGAFLDGSKTYKLNVPAPIPVVDFWSVVLYDPQTRSELQTGQPFPSKNGARDPLAVNDDGSIDLYFGPTAPAGHEDNWIQTVAGKMWFAIFRLYGPLEPWFDKTWRPGDVELIG